MTNYISPFFKYNYVPPYKHILKPKSCYTNTNPPPIHEVKKECTESKNNSSDTKQDSKPNLVSLSKPIFEFNGIKLYEDDLLILAVIYFLYKQDTHDNLLIIALLSLLF